MCNQLDKTLAALSRAAGFDSDGQAGYLETLDALTKIQQNIDAEIRDTFYVPFSDPDALLKRQAN